MKKYLVIIIVAMYIAGCASPTPVPTETPVPSPTSSPLPTLTVTPLPTDTPQPTQTPVVKKDLKPIYNETISQEFMGVQITTNLITDESLSRSNPKITQISINPNFKNGRGEKVEMAFAHFIARVVFSAWWENGEIQHQDISTETDFKSFMNDWSMAQKENDPELWKKLHFSIFANDLNTQGYTQEKVTLLPMYTENQAPDGVKAVREINIVFVRGPKMENISLYSDTGPYYGDGMGANIDNDKLYIYVAIGFGYNNPANNPYLILGCMGEIANFVTKNKGGSITQKFVGYDEKTGSLLATGRYRSAIIVHPHQ